MLGKLFLFISITGFCDVCLLVYSAQYLTIWGTISLCLFTAFLGSYLVKKQGYQTWVAMKDELCQGHLPSEKLMDGLCIIVGGSFLITPGFITDLIGILLLTPVTRRFLKPIISQFFVKNMTIHVVSNFPLTPHGGSKTQERDAEILEIK